MSAARPDSSAGLARGLNLWDTSLLVLGLAVGGGIFLTPLLFLFLALLPGPFPRALLLTRFCLGHRTPFECRQPLVYNHCRPWSARQLT